jgi:hypothetical protein
VSTWVCVQPTENTRSDLVWSTKTKSKYITISYDGYTTRITGHSDDAYQKLRYTEGKLDGFRGLFFLVYTVKTIQRSHPTRVISSTNTQTAFAYRERSMISLYHHHPAPYSPQGASNKVSPVLHTEKTSNVFNHVLKTSQHPQCWVWGLHQAQPTYARLWTATMPRVKSFWVPFHVHF